MNKAVIIGICGSKKSGKTTSAAILKGLFSNLNIGSTDIVFAAKLKSVCAEVLELDPDLFESQDLKERELEDYAVLTEPNIKELYSKFGHEDTKVSETVKPHVGKVLTTPRHILQYVGTDMLHKLDKMIHVKAAMEDLALHNINIIADLRFVQEYEYLVNNFENFVGLYIKNDMAELAAKADSHPSELEFHKFKHKVIEVNNSEMSMQKLQAQLTEIARRVYAKNFS